MLERVEATFTHLDEIWFYSFAIPDHRDPNQRRGLVIRGIPDAVWINQQGQRFHNENLTGGFSGTQAVLSQDPAQCWAVVDAPMSLGVTVSDRGY
jgi:hypothetical protein